MSRAVIVSAVRTAVGSYGKSLNNYPAVDLGAAVIKEVVQRIDLDPMEVDEVIMGNVLQAGLGQNPARLASIKAGLPVEIPAYTVNKVCGSGLKTIAQAAQIIKAKDAEVVIAGGMENMSLAPYLLEKARWGHRMGDGKVVDEMITDGLWCGLNDYHMGITAENVAAKFGITRAEQDEFALESQKRAALAIGQRKFENEILPLDIPQRKGDYKLFKDDEHPRSTTLEKLTSLRPAFKKDGTVTAGNASGINDGAGAVVVMSEERAKSLGLTPLAYIKSSGSAGVDPALMGIGPVPASRKALQKAGLRAEDMDLIEANEAFASQAIAVCRELGLNREKVNVNGGAIALGHPIGASGTRILITLLYEMIRRGSELGLATLCIGGGQGAAVILER